MDDKYLEGLYNWIVSKDPTYKNDVSPDTFKQKMADSSYVTKIHGWVSSLDPSFKNDVPLDVFTKKIGVSKVAEQTRPIVKMDATQKGIQPVAINDPFKKKDFTVSSSEVGSSVSQKLSPTQVEQSGKDLDKSKWKTITAPPEEDSYRSQVLRGLSSGIAGLNEVIASLPEAIYTAAAFPQNLIALATGKKELETSPEKFKKTLGITNPLLEWAKEDKRIIDGSIAKFNENRYQNTGIVDNFMKGNYKDGFELLGTSIAQSVPTSLAIMAGGAATTPVKLAGATTAAFLEQNREELGQDNPDMSEAEKTFKAFGMSAAESVFSAIGTGTIGQVYRDIIKREGREQGAIIFKDGLIQMYKKALEKTGPIAGFAGEGLEEAATQITQNMISGKPAFQGVADAFVTGAGSGVMFTAPIGAINAKKYVQDKVETYSTATDIASILDANGQTLGNIFNVPVQSEITPDQIAIANMNKSRDILVKNLKKAVDTGAMPETDAKQSLYVFDKIQQVSSAVKDLDVTPEDRANIATLLQARDELKVKIANKDDVLIVKEKQQIEDINGQISDIILNSKKTEETGDVAEIPSEISSLKDDQPITLNVKTLEEIPEQFRDRAELSPLTEIETREKILGLPIGKKGTKLVGGGYTYTLTGKEAKDYAIQEQAAGQVPVQSETIVGETMETGEPQAGSQVVTEEGQQVETLADVESTAKALDDMSQSEEQKNKGFSKKWYDITSLISEDKFDDRISDSDYDPYLIASEEYHKAKADGSNPELVEAVENLLAPKTEQAVDMQVEVPSLTSTVRITNANIRYDEDLKISEEYNQLLSTLSDDTKTEQEKQEAEIAINKIIEDQTNYFKTQVDSKLKDINANVSTLNTFGYWKGEGEHSFEVQIEADTKEDYFKAIGRIADFSSEQSQDAFIEVVPLSEADISELENEGVEILNTKMEDNSNVTRELTFEFENTLSLAEVSELSSALADKGIDGFTASKNNFSVIYLSDNPSKSDYDQWLDTVDETFKNFFNGKTNNFSGYASGVRTWFHSADSQDTRSRTYKSVKNNLQKRYEAQPGYGNKRAGDQGDNGQQTGEQEGSRDDIGGPDVNNTLDTQQFFTDVENGKHKPNKDLEFVLPLTNVLKKIHKVWSKFKGNFDEHIETNIPVFREIQLRKINAILAMLPNGGNIIDLGGSTGSFVKTITSFNPKIKSENLDANDRMEETHNAIPVKNSVFVKKLFAETYEGAEVEVYEPTEKFDVVHESMLFQFIKEDRAKFIDEIADKYVKEDGIVILEEKLIGKNFETNETNKDQNFKLKYYDKKYLDKKKEEVLFGMKNNQATQLELEDQLKRRFKFVSEYWDGGNFKGYVASNSQAKVDKFLSEMGDTSSEFSSKGKVEPTINELLGLDTKDKTNLKIVFDALDNIDKKLNKRLYGGANESLLAIPLLTAQAVIKTLKALVKTGITLQEAIKRAAAENNVTEKDVIDTINYVAQQRDIDAKPQEVSEVQLPGYNRMMTEIDGIIEKSKRRGVSDNDTMQNVLDYMQKSKVYENASDTQREKMVRDIRKMFGKSERTAPKPAKLFGELKDTKMITMSEYDFMTTRLKEQEKTIKSSKALWVKTSNSLTKYLKGMVKNGHITIKQAVSILRKFSNTNMFDERSIDRFVDYMRKVFDNADYADKIAKVNKMLKTARKNIQTKIGTAQTLYPLLSRMLAINPTLIPDAVFDDYVNIVTMMGERKVVLDLQESGQLTDMVETILDAVDADVSRVEELTELFDLYQDKITDSNGKVDFAATVALMVKDQVITEKDAELMRKYKKDVFPMEQREQMTEEEIEEEKQILISAIQDATVDTDGLPMKDERDLARELERLIQTNAISDLDNTQLKNILRLIENINNGYMPHFAELVVERLNAKNNARNLNNAMAKAKPLPLSSVYSNLKRLLTRKDRYAELIRRNPLFYIDQVFGNFNTKAIYNAIFEKAAEAQAMFKRSINELNNKLDAAEDAVAKSFKFNGNKITMSKFKMMTYMLQLEYESNPDTNKVNAASKYIKKTIDHINNGKSRFGDRDANMLQQILKDYGKVVGKDEKGKDIIEIDNQKLYDSFNKAEKNAIKVIQNINQSMRDKAIYTAAVIRGDKIHPLNDYIHHNVLYEYKPDESLEGAAFIDSYKSSLNPSTKAKSLIERSGGITPLNFDVFASAHRGAKFVLMDYYLTQPIRTARKTINETRDLMKERGASRKETDIFNAVDRSFEEALTNLLVNNFTASSFGDKASDFMAKQGYRAVLASLPRFAAELSSNVAFAMIADPKAFMAGVSYKGVVFSAEASTIMNNLASKQTNRIFPNDTLSGRLIDSTILGQAVGVKGSTAKNDVANKIQQIYNLSLKKYLNVVELMADSLISTPDKMVMRPMWFGAFANEFKRISGKEIDFSKVAANDEIYMAQNKEALDTARDIADQKTVLTGATDNAFMGVLKGTPKPDQKPLLRMFNMFNGFMTNFLIYEYITARTGIMAATGNGVLSKRQGAALLAAVATRMTLYTLMSKMLGDAFVGLFVDDEEEEDEKSLLQKIGQAMASSATSMILGRDFGNATKGLINEGVEHVNKEYLDFLREGEYDPYKDAIQYTVIPPAKEGQRSTLSDMLVNMMGPFGPTFKTADLAFRKATEPAKKEADAIKRSEDETAIRLPLEVLGNLGMIPLYKDVRKVVNKQIYKDLSRAKKEGIDSDMSKEDMKKYFPDLYNSLYGPGGSMYEVEQIEKELRKEQKKIDKEIEDQLYK